jgi:hypothetical protein
MALTFVLNEERAWDISSERKSGWIHKQQIKMAILRS